MLNLLHYDKSSLLAGKLHAVLTRKYTKGRDLYDLMWYLSDPTWPAPNLIQLNNALKQTGWNKTMPVNVIFDAHPCAKNHEIFLYLSVFSYLIACRIMSTVANHSFCE